MNANTFLKFLVILLLLVVLSGCNNALNEDTQLHLAQSNPPIDLTGIDAVFHKDVSYGKSSNNKFDIFLPHSKTSTPLVIFVHGGGFVGGDKEKAYKGDYPEQIRTLLKNNIAFTSINYRFVTDPESEGIITSLGDSKRCLQFIRYHSEELNIQKESIGMYGSSAGAGTSLWLGFHDDMKIPTSEDPIDRESTRLMAVGAIEAQATYDLTEWGNLVFHPFNITFEQIVHSGNLKTLLTFYHINDIADLYTERMVSYRNGVDYLQFMSIDDPPIWVRNSKYEAGIPQTKKELNHHPFHAKVLKEYADNSGIESVFYIPQLLIKDSTEINMVEFMINKLK